VSTNIPALRLYDYQGGSQPAKPGLNPNKVTRFSGTDYTPEFTLNGQFTSNQVIEAFAQQFQANAYGQLQRSSNPSVFDLISFGNRVLNTNNNAPGYGEVTHPYEKYLSQLEISEENLNALMQQPEFNIPNGNVGIKVKTDGMGGIESVGLNLNNRQQLYGRISDTNLFDRAEITQRAASVQGNALDLNLPPIDAVQGINAPRRNPFTDQLSDEALKQVSQPKTNPLAGLGRIAADFKLTEPSKIPAGQNPFTTKLLGLQPRDPGTRIIGPEGTLKAEDSKNIGAVQAKLNVNLDEKTTQQLAQLRNNLALTTLANLPRLSEEARRVLMPLVSSLINGSSNVSGQFGQSDLDNALQELNVAVDTASKKSSGGGVYMPMNTNSGSQQENPQQQQAPYKPLSLIG
jgi:hypothetical protein